MKTAVITGAGSGVGRAVAMRLAQADWNIALVGRRKQTLDETASLSGHPERCLVLPCDIGNVEAVNEMAKQVFARLQNVSVLVNAAGTNTPKRSLRVLRLDDYHRLLETNLHGAYYCIQAFLPAMRDARSGTIVNVVSDAAKQASPKAGPAYVMSKFGLAGLTQSINAEERTHGVRACAVLPGDIDTPLLDLRPEPPPPEARAKMLTAQDVAECVLLAINLPERAVIEEILIRPRG